MLFTMHSGQDVSHVGAACLPIVVVIMVGRGPLKELLAPLFGTFDALLGAVGGDVERCLLVTAWGRIPTSLSGEFTVHLVHPSQLTRGATSLA
jgi:hypothetical protein